MHEYTEARLVESPENAEGPKALCDGLETAIGDAEKTLYGLCEQLEPFLRAQESVPGCEMAKDSGSGASPVRLTLEGLADRVRSMRATMGALASRVDR